MGMAVQGSHPFQIQAGIVSIFDEDLQPAALGPGGFDTVFTERGNRRARSTRVAFRDLWLLYVEREQRIVGYAKTPADMLMIAMTVGNGSPPVWNGIETEPHDLVTIGPAQWMHLRTEGACRFGVIWIREAEFRESAAALAGSPIAVPAPVTRWKPDRRSLGQLRRLYTAAIGTARAKSGRFAGPDAARGLEQQLIQVLTDCLSGEPAPELTDGTRWAHTLMVRFEEIVRQTDVPPPGIRQLCGRLGTSETVLRRHCQQFLGMPPASYIRRHRSRSV